MLSIFCDLTLPQCLGSPHGNPGASGGLFSACGAFHARGIAIAYCYDSVAPLLSVALFWPITRQPWFAVGAVKNGKHGYKQKITHSHFSVNFLLVAWICNLMRIRKKLRIRILVPFCHFVVRVCNLTRIRKILRVCVRKILYKGARFGHMDTLRVVLVKSPYAYMETLLKLPLKCPCVHIALNVQFFTR